MKSIKRIVMAITCLSITCCLSVLPVSAKTQTENSGYACPEETNINPDDIINAKVIDGELYIDVLYEADPTKPVTRDVGKCPAATKTVTKKMSRNELIKLRDDLVAGQGWSAILGTIVGVGNPIIGAVIGFTLPNNALLNTVRAALNTTKSSFTMTSTFACESVYFGQRGWVHRYRLSNVTIS